MKNYILVTSLLVIVIACSTSKVIEQSSLIGVFSGEAPGYIKGTHVQYILELKPNDKFDLKIKGHDYSPECKGIWGKNGDSVFLNCSDTEGIGEKLSSGYMNQRSFIFKISSKNRLRLDRVILTRQ
jgi:hypothetical protein